MKNINWNFHLWNMATVFHPRLFCTHKNNKLAIDQMSTFQALSEVGTHVLHLLLLSTFVNMYLSTYGTSFSYISIFVQKKHYFYSVTTGIHFAHYFYKLHFQKNIYVIHCHKCPHFSLQELHFKLGLACRGFFGEPIVLFDECE